MTEKEHLTNSDDEGTISEKLNEASYDSEEINIETDESDDVDKYEIQNRLKRQKKHLYSGTYRCNLDAVYKVMMTVKEKNILSSEAKSYINKTPFKNFFNMFLTNGIERQNIRKSASNLDQLITSFSIKEKAFKIGNKLLKITPEEVSLIFGMNLSGEDLFPIPTSNKATAMESFSEFLTTNFEENDIISQKTVTRRLKKMIEEENGNEDLVKLLLLLLIITFFFPNNQNYMQWGFLSKLLNLKKLNSISWPRAICENVMKNVQKYYANPRSTPGCTMVLLV